jgi:hypothetical protein
MALGKWTWLLEPPATEELCGGVQYVRHEVTAMPRLRRFAHFRLAG